MSGHTLDVLGKILLVLVVLGVLVAVFVPRTANPDSDRSCVATSGVSCDGP